MKINFIGFGLIRSGGMSVIFEYAHRLTLRGHDVVFYYPLRPYKFNNENIFLLGKKYYWAVKDVLLGHKRILKDFYDVQFKIKAVNSISNLYIRNADVTIATTWPTAYSVNRLSRKKGEKVHFIQDYEIWNSDKAKVERSFSLNLRRITISKHNQELFRRKFNIETEVILNGINYEIYDCKRKSRNIDKTITFIDHPLNSKGVLNAIEVVKRLKEKYNKLHFVSFGLKKFHDIPKFVKFYEKPDDRTVAKEIYGQTDIFVYPSIEEGFALPPAEAMACKCAVVTTKVGAVPEYSVDMASAIHVEPGNIDELFNGVCYLLDNEEEIVRLSENAYKHIRQKLNWDESVKQFEKFMSQGH